MAICVEMPHSAASMTTARRGELLDVGGRLYDLFVEAKARPEIATATNPRLRALLAESDAAGFTRDELMWALLNTGWRHQDKPRRPVGAA